MLQGFSSALAQIVGTAAPGVEQAYGQASERQQRIAEGYANAQLLAEQASAAKANALLAQQGGTRRIDPGGGSRLTYALGGAVPANLLNQIGLAATATASGYGAGVAGRGQQQLAQRLSEGEKEQAKLREALEDLLARGQASLPEILDRLSQREISKRATQIQQDYLGLAGSRESFDQQLDLAEFNASQNPAPGNPGAARKKAREARLSALATNKEKAYTLAETLAGRTEKALGLEPKPNPPSYAEAKTVLWNRYGRGLMRYAPPGQRTWWKRQIEAMIKKALETAEATVGVTFSRPSARRSGV